MIIAIDGPAGSGKSSTARAVAERLGFRYLDSGAWYRALTLSALRRGLPEARWDAMSDAEVGALEVEASGEGGAAMRIGGAAVPEAALRGGEVTALVSRMAGIPAVRAWLLSRQREQAAAEDVVMDGRDIGTVVFPDAELKVYLDAHPEVRARRRLLQRGEEPTPARVAEEAERLQTRDRIDASREIAPLRRADDAVLVDTSSLTFGEQVEAIVALARARSEGRGGHGGRAGSEGAAVDRGTEGNSPGS